MAFRLVKKGKGTDDPGPIEAAFWQFHRANPQVYNVLVLEARRLKRRGHSKAGIKMLFEVLRWQYMLRTHGDADGFKLNNNYHALYARLIMHRCPDLDGFFELRHIEAREPFKQHTVPPTGHVAPPHFMDR